MPIVKNVSAENDDNYAFKYGNRVVTVSTKAVQFPYGEMRKINVSEGRFFEPSDFSDHRRVVILVPTLRRKFLVGILRWESL